ncbi:hypothetical protein M5K25_021208 [Dendrobium thyrsiflorum]|uniref:alcohol dehydrogenase n=1 Tax=Dendrobium thyrsiflorum TaxID=117978 RepID=A0ABD0UBU8_DENTH
MAERTSDQSLLLIGEENKLSAYCWADSSCPNLVPDLSALSFVSSYGDLAGSRDEHVVWIRRWLGPEFKPENDVFEGPPRQSSTPPSIDSSFEGFEDPLPTSPSLFVYDEPASLSAYDEPVYDMYDDDLFDGVLGVDTPVNSNDKPIQDIIVAKNNGGIDQSVECIGNVDAMISAFEFVHYGGGVLVGVPSKDAKFLKKSLNLGNEKTLKETHMVLDAFTITSIPSAYATLERLKISRQIDTGWTYHNRFSQPNPPP